MELVSERDGTKSNVNDLLARLTTVARRNGTYQRTTDIRINKLCLRIEKGICIEEMNTLYPTVETNV